MNKEIQHENKFLKTLKTLKTKVNEYLKPIASKTASNEYSYLFFAFLLPILIMYVVYIAMGIHPFGEGSVLVLDLNGQYVSFFEAFRNFLWGDASLLYSFSRALGGEFMGMYAYYLASPLSYLVALFPTDRMLEALLLLILLKTGLCGASFGFYLHKNSINRNKFIIVAFSVMYALCAYSVHYHDNIMWLDALICLPLLTYGIEQVIKFGKYKLYIISLAIAVMSNYYIGYMVCIWVVIYFFYYYYSQGESKLNPNGKKNHLLQSVIRIGIFSAIAVMISAVIVLCAYYSLKFGKTDFSNPDWGIKKDDVDLLNFEILDYFTKFLPGTYDTARPEGLPNVYAGTLMIILVPVYFVAKKISSREKIASLFVILFFSLSFILKPLDLIWHGFQRPNWLNYRQSFMLVFFLLVLAYKGFGNLRRVGEKFLLGVGAFAVLFIAIVGKIDEFDTYVKSASKLHTLGTVWLGILSAVAFVALLCLFIKLKNVFKRENVCCAIAALVCVEIFCSTLTSVVQQDADLIYTNYASYNDFVAEMREIVSEVKEDDPSFYRMENNSPRKTNDNMALGIRGISNSTSTLNASTIKFLYQMGYSSKSHKSEYFNLSGAQGSGNPVSDSLLGIKYILTERTSEYLNRYYTVTHETDDRMAYYNKYALSLAYGVDNSIYSFDMSESVLPFDRLNALIDTMIGEDVSDVYVALPIEGMSMKNLSKSHPNIKGNPHTLYEKDDNNATATLTFTFKAKTDDEVFIYIPSDYPRECEVRTVTYAINESDPDSGLQAQPAVKRGTILGDSTKRVVTLGCFEPGQKVDVTLTLKNSNNNLYVLDGADTYFYYLDKVAFESAFKKLSEAPQFIINEDFTDDTLEGTITTSSPSQTVLTTIPYDEGWKVYLDGEKIEYTKTLDALIAFDIPSAGEHTLKLAYRPTPFILGMCISLLGICAFVAIWVLDHKIGKKRLLSPQDTLYNEEIFFELEDFDADAEDYLNTPKPVKKRENKLKLPSQDEEKENQD